VAMGSPTLGTIAELMLQHIENQHIKHLIETGNITYYTRYVDDIFIIYNSTKTTIEEIQSYTDRIYKNLKFTITQENNKQINFLGILITRQEQKM
jgi:organic radical activating enzyme